MVLKLFRNPYFFFAISLLVLVPNFFSYHFEPLAQKGYNWEKYDADLTYKLRSVKDVLDYSDSIAGHSDTRIGSLNYGIIIYRVVKKRFYHGYSYYGLNENWVAALAGALMWKDLGAIVLPDDILKYPMAACSQQSIVLMECFRRRNISFRKIGFAHHFTMEGQFNHKWYYFDPDMEPDFASFPREGIDSIVKSKGFFLLYKTSMDSIKVKENFDRYFIDQPNIAAAPNASIFHKVTKILSKTFFILPLVFGLFLHKASNYNKLKNSTQTI
ncbi:MAG: hypothetical protein ACXVNO_01650 [Bacteroidia bacterium]